MKRAIANATSATHVQPLNFHHPDQPIGTRALVQAHVDTYGNMVVRNGADEFVMIPIPEAWGILCRLAELAADIGFAKS